jgi:rhodanese-related sulfurtransferase
MHTQPQPEIPAVTPLEAVDMIAEGAMLIDVREQDEWDTERIPGAVFRPMSQINAWYQDLPRDRPVIVQCRTGNRSGSVVHALMSQAGFDNVFNLSGGIVGWKFQNQAVDR